MLARVWLVACALALVAAALIPAPLVPQLLYSNNLEHFAAFYITALAAAAAFPRCRLRWLTLVLAVSAAALEASHLIHAIGMAPVDNWFADFGGMLAAYAPMGVAHFRRLFPREAR